MASIARTVPIACAAFALWASALHALAAGSIDEQLQILLSPVAQEDGLRVAGQTVAAPGALRAFYAARGFEPVWTGSRLQRERTRRFLEALEAGAIHGLEPNRYHLSAIREAETDVEAELLLSDAFLSQARHRADGILLPSAVAPDWYATQPATDVLPYLAEVAHGADPAGMLDDLWPKARDYWSLLEAKRRLQAQTVNHHHVLIAAGPTLRPGMTDRRVPRLRERLSLSGTASNLYDQALARAVAEFQADVGLAPDGLLGPKTLAQLNLSPTHRLNQIDANLERWRWLPAALPPRHIRVNAAAYQLSAVSDGQPVLHMPVIVGKPDRPTPALAQDLKYLVFNPYWEVPETIAVADKLPELKRDPSRLAAQGLEAGPITGQKESAAMVPVDQIDWRQVPAEPFPYRLRQRPGPANPLGHLKFMLPNAQEVYLHDTPDVRLFDKCERSFSSGCVRVADAVQLAEWVLQFQEDPWDRQRIEMQITSEETRTLVLDSPIAVFIVYFTSYVDDKGTLRFPPDLYERDSIIISALHGAAL